MLDGDAEELLEKELDPNVSPPSRAQQISHGYGQFVSNVVVDRLISLRVQRCYLPVAVGLPLCGIQIALFSSVRSRGRTKIQMDWEK
jgi:hypothetical protein